jgi:hypothetical protein
MNDAELEAEWDRLMAMSDEGILASATDGEIETIAQIRQRVSERLARCIEEAARRRGILLRSAGTH